MIAARSIAVTLSASFASASGSVSKARADLQADRIVGLAAIRRASLSDCTLSARVTIIPA